MAGSASPPVRDVRDEDWVTLGGDELADVYALPAEDYAGGEREQLSSALGRLLGLLQAEDEPSQSRALRRAPHYALPDVERWRTRTEELELLRDVVVIHTSPDGSRGALCEYQNGGRRAGLESLRRALVGGRSRRLTSPIARTGPLAALLRPLLRTSGSASGVAHGSRPLTAGAALLGGGFGLATLGPVGGTALAGAGAAAAYVASSRSRESGVFGGSATADDVAVRVAALAAAHPPPEVDRLGLQIRIVSADSVEATLHFAPAVTAS
ncbi:hypothetical protein EMIHUDRAFT_200707 [Emiliania huxleyi CCMP1516]|uniref:Uncharacterized protein n=2 Tax=Emiliania huxleyi TaxID=2903 RepID=A0A0D3KR02_EMIH1|nr:hypothetical protein EMIHUDRAFT_200707 [Emiliania huxleyi CCMP1516]EOD38187.1 hypothetical protein EMIHUDRAFT_200707 [Emiliania huxleyi CCMP1516]|eukprot:XP_005790616.1 hypothetical protein EMIHUDRAFT_200707 [Emiliania huxleyi CCMP1516]